MKHLTLLTSKGILSTVRSTLFQLQPTLHLHKTLPSMDHFLKNMVSTSQNVKDYASLEPVLKAIKEKRSKRCSICNEQELRWTF